MKHFFNEYLGPIAIVAALVFTALCSGYQAYHLKKQQAFGSGYRVCTMTQTVVAIGNQAPTTILAAANRQWAMIQQPENATNTVAVSFGGTPTVGSGLSLTRATSTSPVPSFTFGNLTDFPYTGAVSVRTDNGSTTIKVIQCL